MKNYSIIAALLVVAGFFVFADTTETDILSSNTVITQTTPMYHHDDVYGLTRGDNVGDGYFAKLTRTEAGIGLYFKTKDLPKGAYTAWLLVHNTPEGCIGECDFDDIIDGADGNGAAVFRIGHDYIYNDDAEMTLNTWVPVGEFVEDPDNLLLPGSRRGGLTNPMGAVFHIVLKWHGVALNNQDSGVKGKFVNPKALNHELLDIQLHDIEGGGTEHRILDKMYVNGVDGEKMPVIKLDSGFELFPDPQGATFVSPLQ